MTKKGSFLDLANIFPKKSTFTLNIMKEITFSLRPCTPGLVSELSIVYGQSPDKLLAEPSIENLSKVAFFLMDFESQKHFKQQQVDSIDPETGVETTKKMGGYRLMTYCISGISEQMGIYKAILLSMGLDIKTVDELIKPILDEFNNIVNEKVKKSLEALGVPSVGAKSLTRSQKSTVGRRKNSAKRRSTK